MPGSAKGVGSGHHELAALACDLYCPKGPTLRRDPTSALPALKCLIFIEQGSCIFVCVLQFCFSLAFANWIAGHGLAVKC